MMHPTYTELNDFVDDVLPSESGEPVAAHVASCAECEAEVERLRALKARLLQLPRSIPPERDLRGGIWQRLDGSAVHELAERRRSPWWSLRYRLAAAAVLLVTISSLLTMAIAGRGKGYVAGDNAAAGTARLVGRDPGALERHYADELRELELMLRKNRSALAPETIRIMEENLRIIDTAIREARAAIAADPNSGMLLDLLRSAYEQKLELLRQAAKTSPVT